jgi:hypothetical protein
MIGGKKVTYWRHTLRKYDFTEWKGIEIGSAYTLTKNVYDLWMPEHFKKGSAAIYELPAGSYPESGAGSSLPPSETSGFSQQLDEYLPNKLPHQSDHADQNQQMTDDTARTFNDQKGGKRNKQSHAQCR